MAITLKTEALQVATAKASKGTGNLSMLAITSVITIEAIGTDLVLTTTNNAINVEVRMKGVVQPGTKFFACVNSDLFCKLISKQSTEKITLEVMENCLQIAGNGVYNIALIQDEEGGMARITPIVVEALNELKIDAKELKKLLQYNKLAIAKYFDTPIYTGYCATGGKCYTYDGVKACVTTVNLGDIKMLIPSALAELFALFEDKTIIVKAVDTKIQFASEDVTISGSILEGFEQYPAEQLDSLAFSDTFKHTIRVSTDKMADALDRLSLFISDNDQNAIQLNFGLKSIIMTCAQSSACEEVPYAPGENTPAETVCVVDLRDLKTALGTITGDYTDILFSDGAPVCVANDTMRFIIPQLEDETAEGEVDEASDAN